MEIYLSHLAESQANPNSAYVLNLRDASIDTLKIFLGKFPLRCIFQDNIDNVNK